MDAWTEQMYAYGILSFNMNHNYNRQRNIKKHPGKPLKKDPAWTDVNTNHQVWSFFKAKATLLHFTQFYNTETLLFLKITIPIVR